MAKGKQGPNLFDLIYDGEESTPDSIKVPGWWSGRHTSKLKGNKATPVERDDQSIPSLTEPTKERITNEPTKPVSFFQIDGPWIRLSFTSFTAVGPVLVFLVTMVACFEWGSRVGYDDGLAVGHKLGQESTSSHSIDEIELARTQPVNSDLISPLLEGANEEVGLTQPINQDADQGGSSWISGYTYIVIQEFLPDHLDDANKSKAYLQQQGIYSEIVKTSRGGVQLITIQGYNHRDPAQRKLSEQFLLKVHAAGRSYFAEGGGYRLEGYYKLLKNDTW